MPFVLTTLLLDLRPLGEQDFDSFYTMLTDPFIRKYLCDGEVYSRKIIRDFLDSSLATFARDGYGLWMISEKESINSIGFVGLRTFFEEQQTQLIYALLSAHTGKGYATEAGRKVIDYCFEQLEYEYLIASCDAPNIASQRVALNLGMEKFKEEEKNGLMTLFYKIKRNG